MKCVLLSGSPKGKAATSYSLVGYLSSELENRGISTTLHILSNVIRKDESLKSLLTELDTADYIVLAAPLYIDTLPAPVLRVMMKIQKHRAETEGGSPRFIGILNSGFPESDHNNLALDILHAFSNRVGFQWTGGLPFGGGGMVGGTPLKEAGGRARYALLAMNHVANAIANGGDIPQEAVDTIKKQVVPKRLYVMFAQRGWKQMAKTNGVEKVLGAQPYLA